MKETTKETPPLTRRKRLLPTIDLSHVGNTSAYAEKTCRACWRPYPWRKHLRLRGENILATDKQAHVRETPPLTRRKLVRVNFGEAL